MISPVMTPTSTPAKTLTVPQQPQWADTYLAAKVRNWLAQAPAIIKADEVARFSEILRQVALGQAHIIQAGDCAEVPTDNRAHLLTRKRDQIEALATVMEGHGSVPVIRVGRIAGQFAKPRSDLEESVNGLTIPVFRGTMVNSHAPWPLARVNDPLGLLHAHHWATQGAAWLGSHADTDEKRVWTSHEALVLDYETPQVRLTERGCDYLASTHWPWVGERTRDPQGRHVQLLGSVSNPVAVKIGPTATAADLIALCNLLDPQRTPGRLTFIVRMGAAKVRKNLADIATEVRRHGHPVVWMCDPMHANTVKNAAGVKTRHLGDILAEVSSFISVLSDIGAHPGGLHLEATPDGVHECVDVEAYVDDVTTKRYSSLCDPRLNARQALLVASHWATVLGGHATN